MDDSQLDERISLYGETPTEADIDERHPLAPIVRAVLAWRLATDAERERLAYRPDDDD